MADEKLIPGIEYLGRTYDAITMDPLSLEDTSKGPNVFDLTGSDGETSEGGFTVPAGVTYSEPNKTGYESETHVVSSAYELQVSSKNDVQIDLGVPGVFEFSGSQSIGQTQSNTQTRKWTYGYTRAYREVHIVQVDILQPNPTYTFTKVFRDAVAALPVDDSQDAQDKYTTFIKEFGTHFTTGVTLGGLAIQRTRGSATRVLQSSEAEETFKLKASAVIDEVSAGISVDNATKNQQSSDQSEEFERSEITLHGGDKVLEIGKDWVESVDNKPTIIKANFETLSELFDRKFFPHDDQIDDKATYLDLAIAQWIQEHGNPGSQTAPLHYGDRLVLAFPWNDGQTLQYPVIEPNSFLFTYPLTRDGRQPLYDSKRSAAIILEPFDQARAGSPIMDRDTFRIKLAETNQYAGPKSSSGVEFNSNAADASVFIIRSESVNVESVPSGQYFTEADKIRIMFPPNTPGVGISQFLTITASERQILVGNFDNAAKFNLLHTEWLNPN
jgi:hypothetical protein